MSYTLTVTQDDSGRRLDNDITDYLPAIDRRLWRGIKL